MKLNRENLRAVLVDDDERDFELLQAALSKAGFTHPLTHFTNGEIALEYFQQPEAAGSTAPHIILLDLNMPLIDGVNVLHRLREASSLRDLPVIVLTGSDDPARRRKLAKLGIFRFLKKLTGCANVISALDHFIGLYNQEAASSALVQSVDVYRSMFENAIEGIFQTTPSGQYLNVNPALAKMYGYDSAEELIEQLTRIDNQLYVDPLRREAFVQAMEVNGFVRKFESEIYRKDGSTIWISENARAVRDAGGKIDYYEGMVEDITERRRAEESRVRSLALLRATLDSTADGILTIGSDRQILSYNERFVKMWRIPADVLAAQDDELAIQCVLNQLQSPELFIAKVRHLYDHPLEESFDVLYFNDGRVIERFSRPMLVEGHALGRVWSFRDITERKHAEEQIAEQAEIIDIAPAAIMVCDLQSNILFWNKGAETIYGWTRQEALGRTIPDLLFPEEGPDKYMEIFHNVLNNGAWEGEVRQMTRERKKLVLESRRILMRNAEDQPKSVLIINTDITEKKQIEAQSMRAQRLESIGTLAGGIAHDLNNVLAPILMSIGLLRLTARDNETKTVLDAVEASARRGAAIVKQVLSFARGMEGERIEIQLKHLFREINQFIKDTFPKNIEFHISIPYYLWTIMGDSTQLHQVLLNLCVNARDAMPNGGHLTITAENRHLDEHDAVLNQQAQVGPYVILSVTDTGTGIPPDVLDKIFDPFFTTKESGKGTGLGLSITMGIVKSHGGFITVCSDPGKGTTFRVHLPAETSFAPAQRQSQPAGLPRGNGETILVVDDEASILTITSQALFAFGYKVRTATNGAQGIALYKKHQKAIAAIITDMAMPVMDGLSMINAIKKIKPDVKIIAASGLHDDGSMTRAAAAGVRCFLNKPCATETLLKTLQEVLHAPAVTKPVA